jgi:hypothetical protein
MVKFRLMKKSAERRATRYMLKMDARAFCDDNTAVTTVAEDKVESPAHAAQQIQISRAVASSGLEPCTSNRDEFACSSVQGTP